MYLINCIFFLG